MATASTPVAEPDRFNQYEDPAPTPPEGFRSEAEIKALRILDEIEEEQNDLLLADISGRRCAKRQRLIYAQAFGSGPGDANISKDWTKFYF